MWSRDLIWWVTIYIISYNYFRIISENNDVPIRRFDPDSLDQWFTLPEFLRFSKEMLLRNEEAPGALLTLRDLQPPSRGWYVSLRLKWARTSCDLIAKEYGGGWFTATPLAASFPIRLVTNSSHYHLQCTARTRKIMRARDRKSRLFAI